MLYHVARGLDIELDGAPEQRIDAARRGVSSVALVGDDFPGRGLTPLVRMGQRVRLAQALATDRGRPEIRHVSPGAGIVREVLRGDRRRLLSIEIALEGEDEERFEATPSGELSALALRDVTDRLLACGLWTALRTRPFDRVPDPGATPHSIFVTALDSAPLAARAEVVLAGRHDPFVDGLRVLARLTPGTVHLCRRPGAAVPTGDLERVRAAEFSGPHPAGLVGTHVHLLDPVGPSKSVWYVGYQDVVAIGELFTTGRLPIERVVSLAGPMVLRPRLVRTRLGAALGELVAEELRPGECRVVSGSALGGRQASGWGRFLGRYHTQVIALEEGGRRPRRWRRERHGTTALHGRPSVFFPTGAFERVLAPQLLATPLLRALLVGDAERAQALGCLELGEEDLALCAYVCPGKLEYGAFLRAALERLEETR
jgi:Na+-transporting NADH:ubiquinone oxidoreductase subunit A